MDALIVLCSVLQDLDICKSRVEPQDGFGKVHSSRHTTQTLRKQKKSLGSLLTVACSVLQDLCVCKSRVEPQDGFGKVHSSRHTTQTLRKQTNH